MDKTTQQERQRQAPEEIRRAIARANAAAAERDAMVRTAAAELDKVAAQNRAAFEAVVRDTIETAGGVWLQDYRQPDPPERFGASTMQYFARFDPAAVGLWPIALTLQATGGYGWRPAAYLPWCVHRPAGDFRFSTLLEAIHCAALHSSTPF